MTLELLMARVDTVWQTHWVQAVIVRLEHYRANKQFFFWSFHLNSQRGVGCAWMEEEEGGGGGGSERELFTLSQ